ncbi:nicotinate-nucleotide--dimethylbenzimidazole phosphoribosyltransferase [Chloroflexi bacterium TSY]|nr:nicotinate-nucleotide--dimethylbenzimidazole phosphoribosyltransferase [Chloroflexi bacterium TSY]
MSQDMLNKTIDKIGELNGAIMEIARLRQEELTKPSGTLGRLESLSVHIAGICGEIRPTLSPRTVIVCAADHGVVAEQVSAYPQEVTHEMVSNILAGGAAINALARIYGLKVIVVDVGVVTELPHHIQLRKLKIRRGTANLRHERPMNRIQALTAIETGIVVANAEIAAGTRLLIAGDMGIGNSTSGAAIASALTKRNAYEVTSHGTGVGLSGWRRKCQVIEDAIARHKPNLADLVDLLSALGGFEMGAITGVILAAVAARIPILIDGLVSAAGAAIAAIFAPQIKQFVIAGSASPDPGHKALLDHLSLEPVLNLDMRLGEGTGAAMAVPILEGAVATLSEMATFDEAHVSRKQVEESVPKME